jgi:hypothetical protein
LLKSRLAGDRRLFAPHKLLQCICTDVVAQKLLHRPCYTGVVTQESLHRSSLVGDQLLSELLSYGGRGSQAASIET